MKIVVSALMLMLPGAAYAQVAELIKIADCTTHETGGSFGMASGYSQFVVARGEMGGVLSGSFHWIRKGTKDEIAKSNFSGQIKGVNSMTRSVQIKLSKPVENFVTRGGDGEERPFTFDSIVLSNNPSGGFITFMNGSADVRVLSSCALQNSAWLAAQIGLPYRVSK